MSKVDIGRFRELRQRAEDLLRNLVDDLRPFLHQKDRVTFRRKPESKSIADDVNVTTTCSCLMALAQCGSFATFYKVKPGDPDAAVAKAREIVKLLVAAPWMSSGLTENNAFSTTLVLRTVGLLVETKLLSNLDIASPELKKAWDLYLGIKNTLALSTSLRERSDEASKFLYSALSESTRSLITQPTPNVELTQELEQQTNKVRAALALDLSRLLLDGSIYTKERFPQVSKDTVQELIKLPPGYDLACRNRDLLVQQFPGCFVQMPTRSVADIAAKIAEDPEHFAINAYSPSSTVLFWFVDGVRRGRLSLSGSSWKSLCEWATKCFNRERSLVLAKHDAMMDPIAMAMAACLCSRLRAITNAGELGSNAAHREILPSALELEHSIQELFKRQAISGIWPKYFPLFHYQDAGSNFCFTFEMLEAVLSEFGRAENTLIDGELFVKGLEDAVTWCERNRLQCCEGGNVHSGWNSGGDIEGLKRERPESWATAVVHMFLWELSSVLSQRIQKRILEKYKAQQPQRNSKGLDGIQDIRIYVNRSEESLVKIMKEELVLPKCKMTETAVRCIKLTSPLSPLLFGPPGTSKTQLVKAVANDLFWPLVEINPSEFVKGSFENVYLQAEEIFTDLMDLSGAVVLFDEMDALTQKRGSNEGSGGANHLDTATQFLTTSMLPKLANLHDKGGVVFFMATNFQENFDPAIKRAGRFDLLLCMGPPKWDEKIQKLELFLKPVPSEKQIELAKHQVTEYVAGSTEYQDRIELFTFGEFKSFLMGIGDTAKIGDKLKNLGKTDFRKLLRDYSANITLDYGKLRKLGWPAKVVRSLANFEKHSVKLDEQAKTTELARYLRDRRESKRQY